MSVMVCLAASSSRISGVHRHRCGLHTGSWLVLRHSHSSKSIKSRNVFRLTTLPIANQSNKTGSPTFEEGAGRPKFLPFNRQTAAQQRVLSFQRAFPCGENVLVVQPMPEELLLEATDVLTDSFADTMGYLSVYKNFLRIQIKQYLQRRVHLPPKTIILVGLLLTQDEWQAARQSAAGSTCEAADAAHGSEGAPVGTEIGSGSGPDVATTRAADCSRDCTAPSSTSSTGVSSSGAADGLGSIGEVAPAPSSSGSGSSDPGGSRSGVGAGAGGREAGVGAEMVPGADQVGASSADAGSQTQDEAGEQQQAQQQQQQPGGVPGGLPSLRRSRAPPPKFVGLGSLDDLSGSEEPSVGLPSGKEEEGPPGSSGGTTREAAAPPCPAGEVVGVVEVSFAASVRTKYVTLNEPKDRPYICNMAVAPAFRGQGHGKRIMSAAEELVAVMGEGEIYLHVRFQDEVAAQLYSTTGYEIVKEDSPFVVLLRLDRRRLLRKVLP